MACVVVIAQAIPRCPESASGRCARVPRLVSDGNSGLAVDLGRSSYRVLTGCFKVRMNSQEFDQEAFYVLLINAPMRLIIRFSSCSSHH